MRKLSFYLQKSENLRTTLTTHPKEHSDKASIAFTKVEKALNII